jgi:beta-lactamase regulating signal transducer with metallopeptidase domain
MDYKRHTIPKVWVTISIISQLRMKIQLAVAVVMMNDMMKQQNHDDDIRFQVSNEYYVTHKHIHKNKVGSRTVIAMCLKNIILGVYYYNYSARPLLY